jgi:hypothetical protein
LVQHFCLLVFVGSLQLCGELIKWHKRCSWSVLIVFRSISDADGPNIADSFYEYLFKKHRSSKIETSGPDTTQAARALFLAVAKLRSENASFVRLVPFIHLGR